MKNTDSREHDIADSDDYYQYHGGMIATVRSLTGPVCARVPALCAAVAARRSLRGYAET